MLHILHSCYSFRHIGGGFTISSRQQESGKGLTFPFFSGFAASDASGGRRFFSDWQSVKRRSPQCLSSHQNTVWWIPRPFSGDSQNTHCRPFDPDAVMQEASQHSAFPDGCFPLPEPRFMKASDLLTPHSFWRMKPGVFAFHFPKIWLPGTKQSCLGHETILFDAANYIVWLAKQYCSGHVLSVFRKWNV